MAAHLPYPQGRLMLPRREHFSHGESRGAPAHACRNVSPSTIQSRAHAGALVQRPAYSSNASPCPSPVLPASRNLSCQIC